MITNTLKSIAVAALLSTAAIPAIAQSDASPTYETQTEMLQTADEALTAVTGAHAARLALFENDIDSAKSRVAGALAEFLDAEGKFNDLTIGDTEQPEDAARYLPFGMSMALSETFKATEENQQALQRAYGLMETGSPDDAIEVLRMASIEVNVSVTMLPIAEVTNQLQTAQNLIDEGNYFDANLALKAVGDSIIQRNFSIDAIPQQGDIF